MGLVSLDQNRIAAVSAVLYEQQQNLPGAIKAETPHIFQRLVRAGSSNSIKETHIHMILLED